MAVSIRSTTRSIRPTATAPGTTRGREPTDAARLGTGRTAAQELLRATTRSPARIRVARRHGVRTVRVALARHTTRAPERMRAPARDRAYTAAGAPRRCSAAISGRRRRVLPTG